MLNIIYEDRDILVVDKPAGLVVDRSETQQGHTLEDWLSENYDNKLERGGIVHRLDKDTSGILLVARSQEVLENLQAQFKQRKIKKEYLALVHGLMEKGGVVDAAIARNPQKREKFIALSTSKESPSTTLGTRKPTFEVSSARDAVTEYEPMERLQFSGEQLAEIFADFSKIQFRKLSTIHYNLFTLVACRPLTGRTHQIRVHLKYIGHPVVSDEKYAGRKVVRLDKRWCPRMFLHARKLGFFHPGSGKWMEMESELPEDLREALGKLSS